MTFSDYIAHTNPIFLKLKIFKFFDLVFLNNALFMHYFYSNNLLKSFNTFFVKVNKIHKYNTRLAIKSSFSIPKVRTNYGKFNIKFVGAKFSNSIDKSIKKTKSNNLNINC
jgi:hypothetical protein